MAERIVDRQALGRAVRFLVAAAWLGGTLCAAAVCFMIAFLDAATFFGGPPTDDVRREGILFSLVGVIVAASGPMGVWFFHRRRGWLVVAAVLVSVGIGCIAYIFSISGVG